FEIPETRETYWTHKAEDSRAWRDAGPTPVHHAIRKLEDLGKLRAVITQNIDYLHQKAGSETVIEFHGNSHYLVCLECDERYEARPEMLATLPPRCEICGGLLKPDFVFFGEPIPLSAQTRAVAETLRADLWLVIGTTGTVMPACQLPREAKMNGATIVEINLRRSYFTPHITDIFLQGKATEVMQALIDALYEV
ncbi:MAG: RNA polymerase subunit sigma, partial [Chloroflexi bacterium]|nr:RNA polymerase subunit sigma [Chloroflexota bacterium]